LEVEQPVACRDGAAFDFHPTLAGVLGAALIRYEVLQVRQPREKRLLAPFGVMEAFHREPLPLDSVVGLISQGAGHRHLRICEHRIPARFLLLNPAPHARAIGCPSRGGDVIGKVAQPLAQRKHAPAFALACPGEQRVALRAQGLADRGGESHEFLRELLERVAQAMAKARPREQRPHTFDRAVEAIREDAPDPIRRLLLQGRALKLLIGLGTGRCAGVFGLPQMPEHTAADNRGEIHLLGETAAVLFIGQKIGGEGQPTPGQDRHQTVVAERTDEARERHRREVIEPRTQCQTEATRGRQQGIAGHGWSHRAVTQDAMRQDGEDGFTPRTLEPPDGDPAQPDADIMRVARQAPAAVTGRLVGKLKAQGEKKGDHQCDKRLPIVKQLKVGGFIVEIDGRVPAGCG